MKKMLLGIFLLLLIIAAVTINSRAMHSILTEMQEGIIESLSLPSSSAEAHIKESFREWEENRKYLALMISESRLDVVSNAYFECMENPNLIISRNKLIYEISQLIKSEKLCFKVILIKAVWKKIFTIFKFAYTLWPNNPILRNLSYRITALQIMHYIQSQSNTT